MLDDHHEDCGEATPFQYSVPNLRVTFGRAKRNIGATADMRGPGAVPGLYATESAMNELADQLKIDPVQLRVLNEPKIDEGLGIPFSSRHLLECFELGAEKFGWSKRTPEVGSMKRDGLTLGWGMAGCAWIAARFAAEASVQLRDDGTARVACATQDIGTGTYTILAQLAAAEDRRAARQGRSGARRYVASGRPALGRLDGDRLGGPGRLRGGRQRDRLAAYHRDDDAGLAVREASRRTIWHSKAAGLCKGRGSWPGACRSRICSDAPTCAWSPAAASSKATFGNPKPKFSTHSFGCHFVEVTWQPEIARLRVSRVVTVIDAGRILNPLAGRNQIEGAVVMGIGMALFEHTSYDPQNGAPINSNLADYVVAVNADAPPIDVHFLDYPDKEINELGARGIGEIGLAGIAAAITAAVHHATGVRVRELPVKIEDLLA